LLLINAPVESSGILRNIVITVPSKLITIRLTPIIMISWGMNPDDDLFTTIIINHINTVLTKFEFPF